MKRYMLFGYNNYYPGGGLSDLVGTYATPDDALLYINSLNSKDDNYELFDLEERKEIKLYARRTDPSDNYQVYWVMEEV